MSTPNENKIAEHCRDLAAMCGDRSYHDALHQAADEIGRLDGQVQSIKQTVRRIIDSETDAARHGHHVSIDYISRQLVKLGVL